MYDQQIDEEKYKRLSNVRDAAKVLEVAASAVDGSESQMKVSAVFNAISRAVRAVQKNIIADPSAAVQPRYTPPPKVVIPTIDLKKPADITPSMEALY